MKRAAVVLTSGGLDSTTVLALARSEGYDVVALTFDYGQKHRYELKAAQRVAEALWVSEHIVFPVPLHRFGGSALTDRIPVPVGRTEEAMRAGIPLTYVPARNTVFLSIALALAETRSARDIFIGVNALDYSGYPDCRPEYIRSFEAMANLATREAVAGRGVTLHAPLIAMTKAQIIRKGLELGVDYALTHSCYDPGPSGVPCAHCDACVLRQKGFREAGVSDPALPS